MKSLIFIALLGCSLAAVTLDLTKKCGCADKIQSDCIGFCIWANNACRKLVCSDFPAQDHCFPSQQCKWASNACSAATACTDFATESFCLQAAYTDLNCVWGTACAAFTSCASLTPISLTSTSLYCPSVNKQTCLVSPTDATKCIDYTPDAICNSALNQAYCEISHLICVWATTCKVFTACSMADGNSTACGYKSACTYTTADNKCISKTCAAMTTEATCTFVSSFDSKSGTLCAWTSSTSKCADAADTKALTASTCKTHTADTYTWDGTNCNKCIYSTTSNSYILGLIVALLVLFI